MTPSAAGKLGMGSVLLSLGDARRALLAFVDLLEGRIPSCAERWEASLLAQGSVLKRAARKVCEIEKNRNNALA
jgi:hypothetical protein